MEGLAKMATETKKVKPKKFEYKTFEPKKFEHKTFKPKTLPGVDFKFEHPKGLHPGVKAGLAGAGVLGLAGATASAIHHKKKKTRLEREEGL